MQEMKSQNNFHMYAIYSMDISQINFDHVVSSLTGDTQITFCY